MKWPFKRRGDQDHQVDMAVDEIDRMMPALSTSVSELAASIRSLSQALDKEGSE
jgi:hypothetical protein